MSTPYMNLTLPSVLVTAGPSYANQVNAALMTLDSHNHAPGNGVQVPSAGLNINGPLAANGQPFLDASTLGLRNATSSPAVGPLYLCNLFAKNGDLWYRNATGTEVQVTSGVATATSGGFYGDYTSYGAQASYSNSAQAYSFANPNTSLAKVNCAAVACTTLAASSNATVGGTLSVTGNASLGSSNLGVATATTLNVGAITATANMTLGANSLTVGAINATGRLNFTGTGDLQVAGTGSISTLAGGISSAGTLSAAGNVSFTTAGTVNMTTATLNVFQIAATGTATFSNGLQVTGAANGVTTPNLTVSNSAGIASATLSGITTLSGTLVNTGSSSFKSMVGPFYYGFSAAISAATNTPLTYGTNGMSSAAFPTYMPFAGSIVGISGFAAVSTGSTSLQTKVVKNGTNTTLTPTTTVTTSSTSISATATKGTIPFAAGDNLRVDIQSSAAANLSGTWNILVEFAP